jgi:hypothetical protein
MEESANESGTKCLKCGTCISLQIELVQIQHGADWRTPVGNRRAPKKMKSSFEYRSYKISAEDGRYIASSMDDEPCFICSNYLLRVLRAVDNMWQALDGRHEMPAWLKQSWGDPMIDLDVIAGEILPIEGRRPIQLLHFPTKAAVAAA